MSDKLKRAKMFEDVRRKRETLKLAKAQSRQKDGQEAESPRSHKFGLMSAIFGMALLSTYVHAETVGYVSTKWRPIGTNDKIVVDVFDDPSVKGVSCYMSHATVGGPLGGVTAEDSSDASIACRQSGPVSANLEELFKSNGEQVFKVSQSVWFKSLHVVRMVDVKRKMLIYMTYSDKLIDGSPKNAITAVYAGGSPQ
jgi:CreA protein